MPADRDAEPAAPSAAAEACTARLAEKGFMGITTRAIFRDGWMDALAWRDGREAPHHCPHAPPCAAHPNPDNCTPPAAARAVDVEG